MTSSPPLYSPQIKVKGRTVLWAGLTLLFSFLLSACTNNSSLPSSIQSPDNIPSIEENVQDVPQDWTRHDGQGAVEFSVTPVNITKEAKEAIEFEVFMNTHSVDLSMDLAALSTLETNLGEEIHALSWTGGSGHHVRGILTFPTMTNAGELVLDGISNFTLIIRDVDAQVREFVWEVNSLE